MLTFYRKNSVTFSRVHWISSLVYKTTECYSGESLNRLVWQDTAHGRFLVATDNHSLFAVHESRLDKELKEHVGFKVDRRTSSEVVLIPLDKGSDGMRCLPDVSPIYAAPYKRRWCMTGGASERKNGHVAAAALLSSASIVDNQPKLAYREGLLEAALKPFASEECGMQLIGKHGCVVFKTKEPGLFAAVMPMLVANTSCFTETL